MRDVIDSGARAKELDSFKRPKSNHFTNRKSKIVVIKKKFFINEKGLDVEFDKNRTCTRKMSNLSKRSASYRNMGNGGGGLLGGFGNTNGS